MTHNQFVLHTLSTITIICLLASCGGGGEDSNNNVDNSLLSGFFLDSAVEGVEYVALVKTGENTYSQTRPAELTTKSGKFQYKEGEYIRFYIGNIVLAYSVPAKTIITPLDITVDAYPEHSINIARFLQTLDNDAYLDNGITIIEAVRDQASTYTSIPGFNLAFETGILPIVEELTGLTDAGVRSLVDYSSAQTHLSNTFYSALSGDYPFVYGIYTGTYTINVSNCLNPADDGTYNFSVDLSIDDQNQAAFSGTAVGTINYMGDRLNENISLSGTISASGEIAGDTTHTFVDSGGTGTFTGQLSGDTLTIANNGSDTYGDTCSYTRNISVNR